MPGRPSFGGERCPVRGAWKPPTARFRRRVHMLSLDRQEVGEIAALLAALRRHYESAEDPSLLLDAPVRARLLPQRVQEHLNLFRRQEPGYAVISGHPIDDASIGPTPRHWNQLASPSPTLDQDLLLVLYAALLGDAFGWATQQDGRVVL